MKIISFHTITYKSHKSYVKQQKWDLNEYIIYTPHLKIYEQVKLIYRDDFK